MSKRTFTRIATHITLSASLVTGMLLSSASQAAIEINENDFGPTYESMIVDTVVGKPLQLVTAVAGTVAYVASLPFSIVGNNHQQAQQKLVSEPWEALQRCLGCTVAEDKYYKSQDSNNNTVRLVVDKPSEVIINTNDTVVVVD